MILLFYSMSLINSVFVIGIPISDEVLVGATELVSCYGMEKNIYQVKTYNSTGSRWIVLKEFYGRYNLHNFTGCPASFDEIDNFIRTLQAEQIANYDAPIQMRIISLD